MLIYDVGMHNGDDTDYYLRKGASVVGIEANPVLIEQLKQRFSIEIASGRLNLLGVGVGYDEGKFPFYVAPNNAPQSSLVPKAGYTPVQISVVKLSSIIRDYGKPDFAKIDVEHVDADILRDLRETDNIPGHVSVEAHTFSILLALHTMGYDKYRLVIGKTIPQRFGNHPISVPQGSVNYKFRAHSSGPFGDDLPTPWVDIEPLCAEWFVRQSLHGGTWCDVHAMKSAP
jgi:FkbM family methyltransferase